MNINGVVRSTSKIYFECITSLYYGIIHTTCTSTSMHLSNIVKRAIQSFILIIVVNFTK